MSQHLGNRDHCSHPFCSSAGFFNFYNWQCYHVDTNTKSEYISNNKLYRFTLSLEAVKFLHLVLFAYIHVSLIPLYSFRKQMQIKSCNSTYPDVKGNLFRKSPTTSFWASVWWAKAEESEVSQSIGEVKAQIRKKEFSADTSSHVLSYSWCLCHSTIYFSLFFYCVSVCASVF